MYPARRKVGPRRNPGPDFFDVNARRVMLESWEAAVKFRRPAGENVHDVEIARFKSRNDRVVIDVCLSLFRSVLEHQDTGRTQRKIARNRRHDRSARPRGAVDRRGGARWLAA